MNERYLEYIKHKLEGNFDVKYRELKVNQDIIVAVSSISSFLVAKLNGAILIWSSVLIIFSSFLGLPGFYIGFFILISHIAALNSCGYPYLFPIGTSKVFKFKDLLVRGYLNEISNSIFDKGKKS